MDRIARTITPHGLGVNELAGLRRRDERPDSQFWVNLADRLRRDDLVNWSHFLNQLIVLLECERLSAV